MRVRLILNAFKIFILILFNNKVLSVYSIIIIIIIFIKNVAKVSINLIYEFYQEMKIMLQNIQ